MISYCLKRLPVENRYIGVNSQLKGKNQHTSPCLTYMGTKKERKIKYDSLRVLLDSGCSDSIAILKYGNKNRKVTSTKTFATGSGQLKTKYKADIKFTLPEFSNLKIITWNLHLTDNENLGYDLILGRVH